MFKKSQIYITSALLLCMALLGFSANSFFRVSQPLALSTPKKPKMKIEIWSDVACPFCYIGKHRFEDALKQFNEQDEIEVEWKSFQLNPGLKTDTSVTIHDYLAKNKGISLDEAKEMTAYVEEMAAGNKLTFNINKTVVANTYRAHKLLHFAKSKGKQLEMEEILFNAYFVEAANVDDEQVLISLGRKAGLEEADILNAINSNTLNTQVDQDLSEAKQLGISGVPFFVFNRKYAISGAQDSKVFLQTIEKAFKEWKKANPNGKLEVKEGAVCKPDGKCE